MEGQLHILEGPNKGQSIDFVEGQVLLIGRAVDATVRLSDPYISRSHCQIEIKNGRMTLTDLGSTRGTVVNGVKVEGKCDVGPDDVIAIGATKLQVREYTTNADATVLPFSPVTEAAPHATAPPHATLSGLPEDAACLEGTVIAGYQIGKLQGSGSTGVVYQASKPGEAPVALKVFHLELSSEPEARRRFLRAARTMRDLRHPHLVSVFDAGECGTFCWLAMELVEGESLAKVIQRIGIAGILDWRHGLRIAVHVARGLEFAQKQSIIHRNIKPANILLRTRDNFAKFGDLMLAKAMEGERVEVITMSGMMPGDADYSSPERILEEPVDGRSDLFELGATIYALLTGRPPFHGQTLVERTVKLREPASPKRVQLSIPDDFNALVMRLLAKDPAQRFQTPTELLAALEEIARDEKVIA